MKTYKRIGAVRKAGEILKFLADRKEPVGAREIGGAVGLAVGTVMCHLATLEDMGFVSCVGDRYRPGIGLALIWARVKAGLEVERERVGRDIERLDKEQEAP